MSGLAALIRRACGLALALALVAGPSPAQPASAPPDPMTLEWSPLDAAVQAQVEAGAIPGAVLLAGDARQVWLRRAYGWRARVPQEEAMTVDTVFDLASLTKVVATTTAVLQLVERHRLALDAPVARYWPAFASHGKRSITVAQLLTHRSGLRADLDLGQDWSGLPAGLARVLAERPVAPPGSRMIYSDINFIVLGELVRRVSGQPLPAYAQRHIFAPLGMHDTGFVPAEALRPRIAPTEAFNGQPPLRGVVHDPTARRLGGVAGHAGLFGTADDLARFAQSLLGAPGVARVLRPASIAALARPAALDDPPPWRGLGWQLEPPLVADRDALPPLGMIGHTGYTGTGLWIDLVQRRFVVILSNRVHPAGRGDARPLRRQVLALLSSLSPPLGATPLAALEPRLVLPWQPVPAQEPRVRTGLDALREDGFAALRGRRVGLITNLAAVDGLGWRALDRLRWADGVRLVRLFSPEHGLYRDVEGSVPSGIEPLSGLPVFSLYGRTLKPTPEMLAGLDVLVFDVPDAGVRYFTYVSTMGLAMEAAAEVGLPFVVPDRPNPLGAERVGGPMLDPDQRSFTAYAELPVQHGMTVGELAALLRDELRERRQLTVDLTVVPMRGYRRAMRFDQTGLDWVPPSPNLRTLDAALLYPGTAWVEGANVSVGRGTGQPFAWIGAPWIDGVRLAEALTREALPGISVSPVDFVPQAEPFRGQPCHGVAIRVTGRAQLDAPLLGVTLVQALWTLWPQQFQLERTAPLIGSRQTLEAVRQGLAPRAIAALWQRDLARFAPRRAQVLLYPSEPATGTAPGR